MSMQHTSFNFQAEHLRQLLDFSAIVNSSLEIEEIRKKTIDYSIKSSIVKLEVYFFTMNTKMNFILMLPSEKRRTK